MDSTPSRQFSQTQTTGLSLQLVDMT